MSRIIYAANGPCRVVYRPIKVSEVRPNPFTTPASPSRGQRDSQRDELERLELIELGVWLATHKTTKG
jgi:hypothetical protein